MTRLQFGQVRAAWGVIGLPWLFDGDPGLAIVTPLVGSFVPGDSNSLILARVDMMKELPDKSNISPTIRATGNGTSIPMIGE